MLLCSSFQETDPDFDHCAVCIESYKQNDVVRILPCKYVSFRFEVDDMSVFGVSPFRVSALHPAHCGRLWAPVTALPLGHSVYSTVKHAHCAMVRCFRLRSFI